MWTYGLWGLNSGHLAWWQVTLFRAISLGLPHFIAEHDTVHKDLNPEWTLWKSPGFPMLQMVGSGADGGDDVDDDGDCENENGI